jgi:hypothetical protein
MHRVALLLVVVVAACASPEAPKEPAKQAAPVQQASKQEAPAQESAGTTQGTPTIAPTAEDEEHGIDPVALQRQGYRIVDDEGRRLYCRTTMSTGSHLQKKSYCLTARELAALRDSTRKTVEQMRTVVPPPQGH